jgi:hypothetical protein
VERAPARKTLFFTALISIKIAKTEIMKKEYFLVMHVVICWGCLLYPTLFFSSFLTLFLANEAMREDNKDLGKLYDKLIKSKTLTIFRRNGLGALSQAVLQSVF